MRRNSCDEVLLESIFRKKITRTATVFGLIHLFSFPLFLNQKLKLKHRIPWNFDFIENYPLIKTRESHFSLFSSWSVVFISIFRLCQSFFNNSNLTMLVDIQRLHEKGKLILRVSNGANILFNGKHLTALHCFIKLLYLQQG